MSQDELLKTVRAKIADRPAVTVNWIAQRYHVLQSQARKVIADLQAEGLVGREWSPNLGGYPVRK